jgi:Mg2+ and Co2+ transporter CorA
VATPQKTNSDRIREALTVTLGNVTAAAKLLGMAKNSLYKRLHALNIHPAVFRKGDVTHGEPVKGDATRSGVTPPVTPAQRSETDTFPSAAGGASFPAMHAASRVPAPKPHTPKNLSFREDHLEAIGRARRRLAAALDVDLTDSDLIQRFVDDKLEEWVAEQVRQKLKQDGSRPRPSGGRLGE